MANISLIILTLAVIYESQVGIIVNGQQTSSRQSLCESTACGPEAYAGVLQTLRDLTETVSKVELENIQLKSTTDALKTSNEELKSKIELLEQGNVDGTSGRLINHVCIRQISRI